MPRRIKSGAIAIVTLCLLGAACNSSADDSFPPVSSEDESGSSPTATTEATTSTTETTRPTTRETTAPSSADSVPDPSEGEAFDAYIAGRVEAFYEVRDRAFAQPSATPEIDYPELAELAAEPQLTVMYDAIIDLHEAGRAHREVTDPSLGTATDEEHRTSGVQSVDGDELTVLNCEANNDEVVNVTTGDIEIAGTITILEVVTLVRTAEQWKLVSTEVSQKIEGVAGCFLASEAEFPY